MVHVRIEAIVRPTEDADVVAKAITNIFPDARLERSERLIAATSGSLDMLLKKAGEERVMDAARGALWRGRLDERSTRFEVNKQAAAVGRVNFNEVTHPLGDLVVTVEIDDLDALLDRISPPTGAELRAQEGSAAKRAALHREEAALQELGTDIDEWVEDTKAVDEDAWSGDDDDWEDEDYDPLKRRRGKDEEE